MKGKKHLTGRETSESLSLEEQERAVLESGGTLEVEVEEEETFQEAVVEEAEEQGLELHDVKGELDAAEQPPLLPDMPVGGGPPKSTVHGQKMLAEYIRPHFSQDEDGRYCALEFSFPLTKSHKGLLPKSVDDAWRFVEKGGKKGVVGIELADQIIDIYLANDMDDPILQMGNVAVEKVAISIVKEIGKGASTRVVRFSFHAVASIDKELCEFAVNNFGNAVWLRMSQSQAELPLES